LRNLFSVGFLFSKLRRAGCEFRQEGEIPGGEAREQQQPHSGEGASEEEGGFAFPLLLFFAIIFRYRRDGKREEEREQL
jgi:hypothetical protein